MISPSLLRLVIPSPFSLPVESSRIRFIEKTKIIYNLIENELLLFECLCIIYCFVCESGFWLFGFSFVLNERV